MQVASKMCGGQVQFQAGKLHMYDLGSNDLLESIDAHQKAISDLCFAPDDVMKYFPSAWNCGTCTFFLIQKGLVTVSADKTANFWDFELVSDGDR